MNHHEPLLGYVFLATLVSDYDRTKKDLEHEEAKKKWEDTEKIRFRMIYEAHQAKGPLRRRVLELEEALRRK
ncbi:hypothetical protein G293_04980 [Candidatus Liberibacter africanus PTSAPSY]|uniref:Uncharacterized protein n=1 Tax=Candidatus Liberibacter africanus PTSAPSY TaxID=1277257 RepID=A0A0G3I3Z6_LIBAF|nr:hypothetical protein G293_04980 [Candidatus Liberibacter africanus PTSAPSY]